MKLRNYIVRKFSKLVQFHLFTGLIHLLSNTWTSPDPDLSYDSLESDVQLGETYSPKANKQGFGQYSFEGKDPGLRPPRIVTDILLFSCHLIPWRNILGGR